MRLSSSLGSNERSFHNSHAGRHVNDLSSVRTQVDALELGTVGHRSSDASSRDVRIFGKFAVAQHRRTWIAVP
jgi:hypothetical protein